MSKDRKQLALVSGSTSGIGEKVAESLLELGYSVIGIGRDQSRSSLQHPRYYFHEMNLAKIALQPELVKQLQDVVGNLELPLTLLVNNAGFGRMASLEQLSVADITEQINVNFVAHAVLSRAFISELKIQSGDLIFIGSEAALKGGQQGSVYCASKFALRGFAQALREECAKSSLRVSLINPGPVRSDFFTELNFEPGADRDNALLPEDIAAAVVMVVTAPTHVNFDEINLNPLKRVWQRK